MSLAEQIYAQALVLTQDSTQMNLPMLEVLCRSAENTLQRKLREGITPEDCKADFIALPACLRWQPCQSRMRWRRWNRSRQEI